MPQRQEIIGGGSIHCVVLASAGIEWSKATLPSALGEIFTMHLVVPSDEARTVSGTVRELVDATAGLAQPVFVFGVSMNGTIAIAAAAARPDIFGAVIAVTSPPRLPPDREATKRYSDAIEPERKREFDRRKAEAEAAEAGSDDEQRLWRRVDAVRRWHDLSFDPSHLDELAEVNLEWVQAVMADGESYDWSAAVALSQPVLLALGRSDFVVPPISWDLENMPGTFTVEIFERSGHTPFYEQPDEFVVSVRSWLASMGHSMDAGAVARHHGARARPAR